MDRNQSWLRPKNVEGTIEILVVKLIRSQANHHGVMVGGSASRKVPPCVLGQQVKGIQLVVLHVVHRSTERAVNFLMLNLEANCLGQAVGQALSRLFGGVGYESDLDGE